MLVFWVVAIVLIGVVLALILPALLRPNSTVKTDSNIEKREIFRQQFDEIEQDKMSGVLDNAQSNIAKSELERRMLDEIGTVDMAVTTSSPDRRLAIILVLIFPLASALLYLKLGNPVSITIPATSPMTSAGVIVDNTSQSLAKHDSMAPGIASLLDSLKGKLEKNPNDGPGWELLARSYVELKRHAEAAAAFEKATQLILDDPQLLADYADALAVVNGRKLEGKPEELVNRALRLNPHHPKALMLGATAAFNRKDYKQAIVYWERLQQDLPADSNLLPEVKGSLKEAYALSGEKAPTASVQNAAPVANSSGAGISGTIHIAPALASKLDPSATVFVFARPTDGQPMPLAIVRATVKDLPYSYHLDDSSALVPNHKLSQATEVLIVARVSKTGDAKAQTGDLQGMSAKVKPVGEKIDIEINEVLK